MSVSMDGTSEAFAARLKERNSLHIRMQKRRFATAGCAEQIAF
jgi:hypothetical protein